MPVPEFTEQVHIHPETVTKVSTGEIKEPTRKQARYPRTSYATYGFQVHEKVWNTALELSNYEPWRIEIISETEVYIHNNDWRKTRE